MNRFLLIIYICLLSASTKSQTGSTGIGTTTPNASAILDISSNNKGVLLPRITSSQRKSITTPAPGLLVYDTDKRTIFLFDGTQWVPMMIANGEASIIPEAVAPTNTVGEEAAGKSVDVAGNYAIFGAPFYNSEQGAAYIYFKQNGVWTQQAKLIAPDGAAEDRFGTAVAINGDWAIVGAYNDDILSGPPIIQNYVDRGSIYIYQRSGTTWTQTNKLTSTTAASFVNYGSNISLDGDRLIVGAWGDNNTGAAYIYQRSGNLWVLQQRIVSSDIATGDEFGTTVDISGNYAIVYAGGDDSNTDSNVGSVYIFFNNGVSWSQQLKINGGPALTILDNFGVGVAITDSLLLIGNNGAVVNGMNYYGEITAYRRNGAFWQVIPFPDIPDGTANARIGGYVTIKGEMAIVCATSGYGPLPGQGGTYVYKYINRAWKFDHKISKPQGLYSGLPGPVATDGVHIVIGTVGMGSSGGIAIVNLD